MQEFVDRATVIYEAARRAGQPYVFGGRDCSGYVLEVFTAAGAPALAARTAEEIRQATEPVAWEDVQIGDLLFFEGTYTTADAPGPDGHVASHVGISMGRGSKRMWNAVEPVVKLTDLSTEYWYPKLFEARRHAGIPLGLDAHANHEFSLGELLPHFRIAGARWGADPRVIAAVCAQESSFVNWHTHRDGTGHGLFGLDESGGLREYEAWTGVPCGRGLATIVLPPELQIEFFAWWLVQKSAEYGFTSTALRVWHRGPGLYGDERGAAYVSLIDGWIAKLFAGNQ